VVRRSLLLFSADRRVLTKKSMSTRCLLYYITDRTAFAADEPARWRQLLEKIKEAALAGVDYIQLREKDLSTRDLEAFAREAASIVREVGRSGGYRGPATALLINSRTDVALAAGADGVHLRSSDISTEEVRQTWEQATHKSNTAQSGCSPLIAVSCHSASEVAQAAAQGATFAVFAPVFEKKKIGRRGSEQTPHPVGLDALQEACRSAIPVLALGGVSLTNALSCLDAGAAGLAGIRLFQENNIDEIVHALRKSNHRKTF
jgi:thiamine-phosphate pyrophosphorylase